MDVMNMVGIAKRAILGLTLTGMILYGGGCSFRTIGAYLLSDFLRGGSTLTEITEATGAPSLDSIFGDLVGAAT